MSFRPDTIERKLARLERKLREQRDEFFSKSRGVNSLLSGGIAVGAGARGGTGSFQSMRSFIPQDITIDDIDENGNPTGNFEHITLGAGAFLRIKPNTGIAGELKFIHGSLQDGQFLILTPDATQPDTTLTLKTGGNIAVATDLLLRIDEIVSAIRDENLTSPDPNGNFMVQGGSGGGGVACPVICEEDNLGDVSGVTAIDWSLSPFHRMRVIGDTQIVMQNLPTEPGWHEITVQFLEDPVGDHTVTFLDVFRNTPVPVVRRGANRYTIVKFYSYFDGFDHIFTWQPPYLTNSEVAQSAINQGMIHVKLNTDQVTDLAIGDHIEWRTILFTNNMGISSGVGQLAGIFSGFKTSRTYELTASLGVDKAPPPGGQITYQWFDIARGVFIGTQGTATNTGTPLEPFQTTAKAFFFAFDTSDTVELRIKSQSPSPVDTVFSGFPVVGTNQTPESYAIIKDCGQTQQQFDAGLEELLDEPTILLPATPPIGFTVNSSLFAQYFRRNPYSNVGGVGAFPISYPIVNARVILPFQTSLSQIATPTINIFDPRIGGAARLTAGTFGFIKVIRFRISENTLNKAINIKLFRNGGEIGTILTINPGVTGDAISSGNTPIAVGDSWSFMFQTTDSLIPSGFWSWTSTVDIEWGLV